MGKKARDSPHWENTCLKDIKLNVADPRNHFILWVVSHEYVVVNSLKSTWV